MENVTFHMPNYLTIKNLVDLLEEIKNKQGGDEEYYRIRSPKGFDRAKDAAKELGFIAISEGGLHLTDIGTRFMWESDASIRKEIMIKDVLLIYTPYDVAIARMIKDNLTEVESDYVQSIWARDLKIRLTRERLQRCVTFFFQLMEYSGLGKYVIGRRGAQTRLASFGNYKSMIESIKYSSPQQGGATTIKTPMAHELVENVGQDEKEKVPQTKEVIPDQAPPGIEEIKFGEIRIWLPKDNLKSAVKKAKKLLDLVEDKEEQTNSAQE